MAMTKSHFEDSDIFVYAIWCKINDKVYIGATTNGYRRIIEHISKLGRNAHYNNPLQEDWNHYGEEAFKFVIVEECNKSELKRLEAFHIINNFPDTYNLNNTPIYKWH
jgi:group I intron endonuclease